MTAPIPPKADAGSSGAAAAGLPAVQGHDACLTRARDAGALECQGCALLAGEGEDGSYPYLAEAALQTREGQRQAVAAVLRAWRFVRELPAGRLWPSWGAGGTPLLLALPAGGAVLVEAEHAPLPDPWEALEGFQIRWLAEVTGLGPGSGEAPVELEDRLWAAASLDALMMRCPSQRAADLAAGAFRVYQRKRWKEASFDSSVAYPRRRAQVNALGRVEGWLMRRLLTAEALDPQFLGLLIQARHQRRHLLSSDASRYERAVERLEGSAQWVALGVYRELGAQERADELIAALERDPQARHWHWRRRFPLTGMALVALVQELGQQRWDELLALGVAAEDLLVQAAAPIIEASSLPGGEALRAATPLAAWLEEEAGHAREAAEAREDEVQKALAARELRCLLPQGARLQVALSGVDAVPPDGHLWEAPLQVESEGLTIRLAAGWLLQQGSQLRLPLTEEPAWETDSGLRLTAGALSVDLDGEWQVVRQRRTVVIGRGGDAEQALAGRS